MECNAEDTKGSSEKEISDVNADGTLKYNKTHTVCALDVKALLKYIQFDDPMAVFDAGVAAYLLNPLKSSYTYDDMAKEYLSGRILPAREELLGKKTVEKMHGRKVQRDLQPGAATWPIQHLPAGNLCVKRCMIQVCGTYIHRLNFR